MKFLIAFAATFLAVNALTFHEDWINFKVKHGKSYQNIVEEKLRFQVFQDNVQKMVEHNARYDAGQETWFMAINQFSDMTAEEFGAMLKLQNKNRPIFKGERHVLNLTAPDTIDWREKDAVMEVKDQGQCGSCWAFSATGSIEGQLALKKNQRISLSEQQLLDCSSKFGNGDCNYGGDMVAAFRYVIESGLTTEKDYPYEAVKRTCRAPSTSAVTLTGFVQVDPNEKALMNAVGTAGPVSVAMYAEPIQSYGGGIFSSTRCYNSEYYLDHGVLAVGYGSSPQEYWIIKNSWGKSWGESGYFRLARNANQCGIALDSSYPTL